MTSSSEKRTLLTLSRRYPIVMLSGPHGCGKSALARQCFPGKSFIDLKNSSVQSIASKSPKTFLMAFPDGAVINEVSLVPGMIEAIRYHVDRMGALPGKYILTSTRRFEADPMDGRLVVINTLGMDVNDMEIEKVSTYNPFTVMLNGQYPGVLAGEKTVARIIDETIEGFVRNNINISNLPVFRHFMQLCARQSSCLISMNSLATAVGVSAPTAKKWIRLLEGYNVLRIIDSHIFFTDSGVLCYLLDITRSEDLILSPFKEAVTITFALNELLKGRYSKTFEPEICILRAGKDSCPVFLAQWNQRYEMVIEPNIDVTEETISRLQKLNRKQGTKTLVLYLGDVTYSIGRTDCISFRDWSKLASEIDYFS